MTKISQIVGVSTEINDDSVFELETAAGVSEQATFLLLKDYIFSTDLPVPVGTNQSTAFELIAYDNVADAVSSGTGVKLKSLLKNYRVRIRNAGANDLKVYPKLGGAITGLAINAPFTIEPGNVFEFIIYTAGTARYY